MAEPHRRRGPLLLLEAATLMSGTGNGMVTVVFPWLALERTGSAAAAAIVASATALPLLLSSLVSGSIIDRIGRRRSAILSDVLSGISVAAIPIVDHFFGLGVASLVAFAVLGAIFDPAGFSAREAMLPDVAAAAGSPLERVNGIHEAVWGAAFVVGPGVGGILIGTIGAAAAMGVAGVGFACSSLLVWRIALAGLEGHGGHGGQPVLSPDVSERDPDLGTTTGPSPLHHQLWAETKEGLRIVWHDRLLRSVLLLSAGLLAVYLPMEAVLFPVYFESQGSPERMGFVITAFSAGGIAGALLYAAVGRRLPRRLHFVGSTVVAGVGLAAMSFLPSYPVLLAMALFVGVAYGPINPLVNLAVQTRTPVHARGRATTLVNSAGYAAGPLGFIVVGPLVEAVGIERTFQMVGAAVLVVALLSIPAKGLREFDG